MVVLLEPAGPVEDVSDRHDVVVVVEYVARDAFMVHVLWLPA
jgi:hypothetical protein